MTETLDQESRHAARMQRKKEVVDGKIADAQEERGVLVIPDFVANAGGVICAAMEYHGATRGAAFEAIAEKIRANTEAVLNESKGRQVLPRQAAVDLAEGRVRKAMLYRRFNLM